MSRLGQYPRCFHRSGPRFWCQLRHLASALLALGSAPALAQSAAPPSAAPEQVKLTYVADAGCPTEAAFVNEVGARIRRPIEWGASSSATLIAVSLGQAAEHATGTLEVTRPGAEPTHRAFLASSCAEVGSALALVAALTLDPNARTEPLAVAPTSSEPNVAVAPAAKPASAPPVEAPPPAPRSASAPRRVTPPSPPRSAAPASYIAWLGPVAGASFGYAPKVLITYGLSLGARTRIARGFSPSLQLTPLWGKTGSTGPSAAGGNFAWAMARLEACPAQLALAEPLTLSGCAAGEVGRLSARGTATAIVPVSAERWWAAAGLTAALHFSAGRWFTRLGAQLLFPAIRDTFVFRQPDQDIHRASGAVYGATLGLGVEFGP